ncbi:signal recognition particle-docking protein FtsY [Agrobacterium vitis]|uniref:Signal recognition particle receptor FtsY n=1 Tax=Agrobacterium vitis TaxID=373 RepID=A0AAE2RG71_AGRVI|nr:signal recognition particle-docking protein FtsY [Agrobacterium vitis]MBF2717925.1 signal recognition particle-docking protein FtsY [Agrobacterium vitis]MUZ61819.1 signal recognition particle-docking protein FtsY [Agrobacterium vitis]MVA21824.1 signal recognition particle-docking protein FtsY [Agrobacterium vitis]
MALGFIKKVFTFGKDKPSETGVDAGLSAEEKAAIAAESEPHDRVEQLPLAEDPVLAEEVDTAGGPSDDLAEDKAGEDDVTADDLSLLPLSLLEAEDAAEEHASDATPSFDELLDEAEGAAPGTEIALPKGFSTVVEPEPEPETPEVKQSWFQRLKAGLFRTSSQLTGQISALFTKRKLDEETLEELEDLLIQADLGVETAMRVTATLSSERYGKDVTGEDVTRIMAAEIVKVLKPVAKPLALDLNHKPHVILVVGVNGTGKTTTIGKLAAKLSGSGLKVMLAAGDTFRAAAIEQLKIWADRTGSTFIGTKLGADAAGLAYDAFEKAKAEKSDVLIIDTAGRLQNKTELMDELEKIVRVLSKLDPDAPHTVLQTLDATTGQNAMNQVEIFRNVAGVNGLIMTKLDGTARGGILVAIAAKHKLPVYFIGVGEGVDDLEPFEAEDFARAIAGFGPSS